MKRPRHQITNQSHHFPPHHPPIERPSVEKGPDGFGGPATVDASGARARVRARRRAASRAAGEARARRARDGEDVQGARRERHRGDKQRLSGVTEAGGRNVRSRDPSSRGRSSSFLSDHVTPPSRHSPAAPRIASCPRPRRARRDARSPRSSPPRRRRRRRRRPPAAASRRRRRR